MTFDPERVRVDIDAEGQRIPIDIWVWPDERPCEAFTRDGRRFIGYGSSPYAAYLNAKALRDRLSLGLADGRAGGPESLTSQR